MCLEKGSGQLIVRLTIYAYTSVHNQHQNPFQGTHCSSTISLSRGVKKLETETETILGGPLCLGKESIEKNLHGFMLR